MQWEDNVRAKEFLAEGAEGSGDGGETFSYTTAGSKKGHGTITPHFFDVNPGAQVLDGMDKYYDFYRMSMLMAGAPHEDIKVDPLSWIANAPFVSGYTPADMDKINYAAKKLKQGHRTVASTGSVEPDIVYKKSPVVAFKGYPR